jgi:hypothetical protein
VSNNHTPKFQLKLNEENELDFKLSIEGSVSDQDMAKPVFRFVMTENSSDKGWVFPVKTKYKGSDIFTVKIPALNENVKENSIYNGRLEVIMGNVLMVPTEVMMEFRKPIGVKALPITKSNTVSEPAPVLEKKQEKSDAVLEEEIDAIIGAAPKPTTVPTPKSPLLFNNVMNFLEEEKAQKLAKKIIEERKKQTVQPKTIPVKKTQPQNADSADKEQIKSQLKNLFRSALK